MNRNANQIKFEYRMAMNFTMKSFLQNNDIEMYSTHNEGKSVIAE